MHLRIKNLRYNNHPSMNQTVCKLAHVANSAMKGPLFFIFLPVRLLCRHPQAHGSLEPRFPSLQKVAKGPVSSCVHVSSLCHLSMTL